MTLQYADRVQETTATTGTGTYALAGAVAGYQAFSAACANNDTCYYTINDGTQWEVGLGTWTTGNNLARTTILASSNSNAAVSWSAGSKNITLDVPALLFQQMGYLVSFLEVAGGGGGGSNDTGSGQSIAGAGAGGGQITGSFFAQKGNTYTITIGAGGAYNATAQGSNGGDTSITGQTTAKGGGGGGKAESAGSAGGSGGGAGAGTQVGGVGTSGQGNNGGTSNAQSNSGGGGGAGAVGGNGNSTAGGAGGAGLPTSLITTAQGTTASVGQNVAGSVYFSGGGGGGGNVNGGGGAGGNGGGGTGASNVLGIAGGANTGGGGGGTGFVSSLQAGAAGGSGCVILVIPTAFYSGNTTGSPVVIVSGIFTILIYKSSGTYVA